MWPSFRPGPVSGHFPYVVISRQKRISIRNDSFQTFIDVSSFIILSIGFQAVVEGGNFCSGEGK